MVIFSVVILAGALAGTAAAQDVVEVSDAEDLQAIGDDIDGDYVLVDDIDASSIDEPIGDSDDPFTGTFDGQRHEIENLELSGGNDVGLFGATGGDARIENVGVVGASVSGNNRVGLLVGHSGADDLDGVPVVSNSYATGTVSASGTVGGLVGRNADAEIVESWSDVSVSGSGSNAVVGGLVGSNVGDKGLVSRSYTVGFVEGRDGADVGGLIGVTRDSTTELSYVGSELDVSRIASAGGIIADGSTGDVRDSYWNEETTQLREMFNFGIGTDDDPASIGGFSTSEMQGESAGDNMDIFDFNDGWMVVSDGYPVQRSNFNAHITDTNEPVAPEGEFVADVEFGFYGSENVDVNYGAAVEVDGHVPEGTPEDGFVLGTGETDTFELTNDNVPYLRGDEEAVSVRIQQFGSFSSDPGQVLEQDTFDVGHPAEFEVAVESTNSPVTEGDDLNVKVTVENVGDFKDEQTVSLSADGIELDDEQVSVGGGDEDEVILTWTTESGDAGDGIPVEVSSDDDVATETVTVETAVDEVKAADIEQTAGESGELTVVATGGGEPAEDITIEVVDDGSLDGVETGDTDVTDADGEATFGFEEVVAEDYTVAFAVQDDQTVSDSATVTVESADADTVSVTDIDPDDATVTVSDTFGDGNEVAYTVSVIDEFGNPVSTDVNVEDDGYGVTVDERTRTTDDDGTVTFTVQSSEEGEVTFSFTEAETGVSTTATGTFEPPEPDTVTVVSPDDSTKPANSFSANNLRYTVEVVDEFGDSVTDVEVEIEDDGEDVRVEGDRTKRTNGDGTVEFTATSRTLQDDITFSFTAPEYGISAEATGSVEAGNRNTNAARDGETPPNASNGKSGGNQPGNAPR